MPVLCNLFWDRLNAFAMGMGQENIQALHEVGKLLAFLKETGIHLRDSLI
ncbi:hypothetical protein [Arsenophonus sp. PmNCSU2021_1]